MNAFTQTWQAIASTAREHSAGLFVLVLAAMAIAHTAVGMGRTRQWHLLPVVFGLTALAGFLLNPFADANTLADLRSALTSYETLTLLCVVQFVLLAASLALGIRLDPSRAESRGAIALAVVHTIPMPATLIAMLLIEQGRLAGVPGARPEAVGREVGFIVAGGLALACVAAMAVPRRWLALPHHTLSIAILLACMFVPCLQDPLPKPMFSIDVDSLRLSWKFGLAAAALVVVGCFWPRRWSSLVFRRLAGRSPVSPLSRCEPVRGAPWES